MSQPVYDTCEASTSLKTLRIANIFSFIANFVGCTYFFILNPRAKEIIHEYNNIFSPSLILLAILWPIIYLLRFGFVFYIQFSKVSIIQDVVNESIGWLFTLTNLFTLGWLWFLLKMNFVGSSFFATLFLLVASLAHYRLTVDYPPNELPSLQAKKIYFFAHASFALYTAFSWLDLFNNIYMAILKSNHEEAYALLGILFVLILGIVGLAWTVTGLFSNYQRDGLFGLTMAACLIDVAIRERNILYLSIQASLLAGLIFSSFLFFYVTSGYKLNCALSSKCPLIYAPREQRQPLIQGNP